MPHEITRQTLAKYAQQGLLQGFREISGTRGKTTFCFRWLLGHEFTLVVNANKNQLVMPNLLPHIDNRSYRSSMWDCVALLMAEGIQIFRCIDV